MLAYPHYHYTMMYITAESYLSEHSCILLHILSTLELQLDHQNDSLF